MSGRRFPGGDRPFTRDPTFQVKDIPQVDAEKLEPIERAAIERTIADHQSVIQRLQTDVFEVRSERNALETRLSQLESERDELQERLRQIEVDRPRLEPSAVFRNLGSAIGDVREQVDEESYTIGDVEFTLKANVVQTDEGLRMHLPSLDETFASDNLSEITFRVRTGKSEAKADEPEYNEVPDVLGLQESRAEQRVRQAGLSVGEVTTVEDADTEPGTIVDQFPEPYTLAPPDAPVDLTVGGSGRDDVDTERLREEFERAIAARELDPESGLAARLRDAGIADLGELATLDAERIAAITGLPHRTVVPLRERLVEHVGERPGHAFEAIDGIGSTYADHLTRAGVDSIAELARLDPSEAAEITGASPRRTQSWIEQAQSMTE